METGASSASWIDALGRYGRSRLPARTFLPLALFLCATAWAAGRPTDALGLAWMGALAGALLVQFRLWDDLSDRELDRRWHPERVLAGAGSLTPFHALLAVTGGLSVALLTARPGAPPRLAALLLLSAGLAGWYRWRPSDTPTLAGAHVVLAKYPVFVYLLSGALPDTDGRRLAFAMGTVYLCFGIYELLHDPTLRAAPGSDALLGAELALLIASPGLAILALPEGGGLPAGLWGTLAAAGALLAAAVVRHRRRRLEPGPWSRGVFLVGLLHVLSFAVGGGI